MDLEASVLEEEEEAEPLMKVVLMVLTEMPYSSTSALRQSKKAWTACLEAASGRTRRVKRIFTLLTCACTRCVCSSEFRS